MFFCLVTSLFFWLASMHWALALIVIKSFSTQLFWDGASHPVCHFAPVQLRYCIVEGLGSRAKTGRDVFVTYMYAFEYCATLLTLGSTTIELRCNINTLFFFGCSQSSYCVCVCPLCQSFFTCCYWCLLVPELHSLLLFIFLVLLCGCCWSVPFLGL